MLTDTSRHPPREPLARGAARLLWIWGPAILVMSVIFWASSLQDLGPLPGDVSDKTGHFVGYALLGAAVVRATAGARWSGVTGTSALRAWGISVAYGVSDELHQAFVPGRSVEFGDVVADAFGAAAAILLLLIVASLMRRRARTV